MTMMMMTMMMTMMMHMLVENVNIKLLDLCESVIVYILLSTSQ